MGDAVLQISQTNEFDANLSSITHKLQDSDSHSMTETTSQAAPQMSMQKSQMSQVKQGLTSVVNVTLPSQLIKQQQHRFGNSLLSTSTAKIQEETKQVIKTTNDIVDNDSQDEEDQNEIDEIIVGKGLGNTLKVLRNRGILGKQLVRGRNMDSTLETQL